MDDSPDATPPSPGQVDWDIRRAGRSWSGLEAGDRWELTPEKFEMYDGKLFWDDNQRLLLLGLLLENVGLDAALRLGDLATWRAALDAADGRDVP